MKFRTVIKLVSDARDKSEALDLVEDYLAGNIVHGVDMKCVTKPVHTHAKIAGVATLVLAVALGVVMTSNMKHSQNILQNVPGVSAVQPPLNTSSIEAKSSKFKQEWQDRQTQEALNRITR